MRRVEQALLTELSFQRKLRRTLVAAAIIGPVALAPEMSSAQGLLDFFFGGGQKQQHQTSFFAAVEAARCDQECKLGSANRTKPTI